MQPLQERFEPRQSVAILRSIAGSLRLDDPLELCDSDLRAAEPEDERLARPRQIRVARRARRVDDDVDVTEAGREKGCLTEAQMLVVDRPRFVDLTVLG